MSYFELSVEERATIQISHAQGLSLRRIACLITRSPSTISRELRRNRDACGGYSARVAQQQMQARHQVCRPMCKLLPGSERFELVAHMLRERLSPEQIAGKLRNMNIPNLRDAYVCRETIYNAIYALPVGELRKELIICLRQSKTTRRPRSGGVDRRGQIPEMVSIHVRPPEIEDRLMPGHWEGDLIKGKASASSVGTLVERTSGYLMLVKMNDATATIGDGGLQCGAQWHSKFNFVEMSRREIVQAIEDNRSSDASHRMNDDIYRAGFKPTPLGIFNYYDGIGRNSCISMEFDTAVRSFLKTCPACIRRDAVYLYGRKYRSPELEVCGVFDLAARNGVINVSVFVLTMCVRHIWIEVNGVLYELDFLRPASARSGMADISLRDLQDIDQLRRDANANHREEKPAIQQFYGQKIKSLTEKERDAGERKLGSPPKNGAAERDTADYRRFQGKAK